MTPNDLDAIRARAEAARQAAASGTIGTPPNVDGLSINDALGIFAESAEDVPALLAEVERLRALIPKCVCGPWHPDMDGPDEECPQHGRSYREWIDRGDRLAATVDRVRALVDELDQCTEAEEDDYARSLLRAARADLRTALEGTDS